MNIYQNDVCHDETGVCAHNIDTILGSTTNTIGRTCYMESYNICISTLILNLEMTIYVIHHLRDSQLLTG